MSSSNCCFLICIRISQEAGQVVWYSHFFQYFPHLWWSTAGSQHGRSCGRELLSKASGLEGLPRPARASTPKPESVCLTILYLPPTLLILTGGYPQPPFSGKINLGLWLISLLDMIGVFQFKPLRWLSSLPNRFIQTLAATRMIVHSLPTVRGTGSLKHRAFQRVKSY